MKPSPTLLLVALSLGRCTITATHTVRRFDDRRSPATAPCEAPEILTDRGGARPRQTLAVVTAECGPDKRSECERELRAAVCAASGDAVIEVAERRATRTLRLTGIAVAWTDDEAPPEPVPAPARRGMQ
ncbi:MAG: hypothetical protein JNK72_22400 [Myxococcales bacterium]|nr:hypothetical protein [Myxococcales bacterium]